MRCVRRACPWNIFCPSSRTTICPLVPGNPSARFIRHPSLQGRMCRAFCSGVDLILLPERFYHPSPPPGYILTPSPQICFTSQSCGGTGLGSPREILRLLTQFLRGFKVSIYEYHGENLANLSFPQALSIRPCVFIYFTALYMLFSSSFVFAWQYGSLVMEIDLTSNFFNKR